MAGNMDLSSVAAELLNWVKWFWLCVVATEAATEIIVDSKLFQPFHSWLRDIAYPPDSPPPDTIRRKVFAWLDSVTSCGYCLSVWVAAFFSPLVPAYAPVPSGWRVATWLMWSGLVWAAHAFAIHRVANWFHVEYELRRRGRVATADNTVRLIYQDTEDVSGVPQ